MTSLHSILLIISATLIIKCGQTKERQNISTTDSASKQKSQRLPQNKISESSTRKSSKDLERTERRDIDSLKIKIGNLFLDIVNDKSTSTHKEVIDFFNDNIEISESPDNEEYPKTLQLRHLNSQIIKYEYYHDFAGTTQDTVSTMTSVKIIFMISAFNNYRKGEGIETILYEVQYEKRTSGSLTKGHDYLAEEKIKSLKHLDN